MKAPVVSVIVTTRNNEATIKACLDSIVGQSYRPIELIVVDNQSTDNTKAIAENYAKLLFDKGPERSAQRNFAAKKASGKYILIGYNEAMTGAEDWEFSDRIRKETRIERVNQYIMHNEGHFKLLTALKKKMYYTKGFKQYYAPAEGAAQNKKPAASALKYYKLYLSKPGTLFKNPFYGFGMLFMKTAEFAAAAFGLILARSKK